MGTGRKNCFSYFKNTDCEYYPCHRTGEGEYFNCLFCYCPLYTLGDQCGGDFTYTEKGIKDCSNCSKPHEEGGYEYILGHFHLIAGLAGKKDP